MSDTVQLALITGSFAVLTILANGAVVALGRWLSMKENEALGLKVDDTNVKLDATNDKVDATNDKVEEVHRSTNGKIEQLLALNKSASFAAGKEDERRNPSSSPETHL